MDEENPIDIKQVIMKLIGPIDPVGATHIDRERLGNLSVMIELIQGLMAEVEDVHRYNKDRVEYSRKQSADAAEKFFKGIPSSNWYYDNGGFKSE